MTRRKKDRAIKKVQIAIDKLIDLKDNFDLNREKEIQSILDKLNDLESFIERK